MEQSKHSIKEALDAAIDNWETGIGQNDILTETQNVELTDLLAGVLENVNPNHNYPPTNKP